MCARAAGEPRGDRTDEDPDRIEPVRHRHHAPAALGLESPRVRVDADVECTGRAACDAAAPARAVGSEPASPGQRCRGGERGAERPRPRGAVALDDRPGDEEHRRDRAECDAEQRQAERTLGDPGRPLHVGKHRRPRAPEEPERDEREQRREASRTISPRASRRAARAAATRRAGASPPSRSATAAPPRRARPRRGSQQRRRR